MPASDSLYEIYTNVLLSLWVRPTSSLCGYADVMPIRRDAEKTSAVCDESQR